MTVENKTFKAKTNCFIGIDMLEYPELRNYVDTMYNKVKLSNKSIDESIWYSSYGCRTLPHGAEITIGDKMQLDASGNISVYPQEFFDKLNKLTVEHACEFKGTLAEIDQAIAKLPPNKQKLLLGESNTLPRFRIMPMLEKVA